MKSSNKLSGGIRLRKNCGGLCGLVAIVLLSMSPGGLAWAQETPVEETEDSSKRVDESEENYRQHMELREQRFNERPKITTTYAVQASEGKLDQLPPASKEHIKDQLRDMIIESRQWKPGEDITDYPYDPSTAAKTDPALHALEREAWVEQLQKHQEREAAAFANATGGEAGQSAAREGDQGTGQQAQGQQPAQSQSDQGQSGQGQSGRGSGEKTAQASSEAPGAASQDQSSAQDDSESPAGNERAAKAISTAGVAESALSFVQGKGGRGGAAAPGNAAAGDTSQGSAPDASQAAPEGGSQAGAQDAAQMAQAANAGSAASASSAAGAGQKAAEEKSVEEKAAEEQAATAEVLAGTLAIDELQNMQSQMRQGTGQQSSATGAGAEATVGNEPEAAPLQEPGTLSIDELKELDQ